MGTKLEREERVVKHLGTTRPPQVFGWNFSPIPIPIQLTLTSEAVALNTL